MKISKTALLILLLTLSSGSATFAAISDKGGHSEAKFNAGEMIMHHVKDTYGWHITKIGETEIGIPLPVILFSSTRGFQFFMSGKLHGEEGYNGFKIAHEGKYEGKIVEMLQGGEVSRPFDLSITKNVLAVFFSVFLILWIFISIAKRYSENYARAPKGTQSWLEPIILFVRDDVAKAAIGEEKYRKYVPYLLTIFFFILINNLLGLVPFFPGGANVTGNISVTLALALFTFVITLFSGSKDYWTHLVNAPGVPWWLKLPLPLMPIVEIMGVFIKPFVLMIRLFANISAGHIIVLGFYSLIFIFGQRSILTGYGVSVVSVAFTIFMGMLELLVAFIQAYVFTLLSAIYFGMAIEQHHGHVEEVGIKN